MASLVNSTKCLVELRLVLHKLIKIKKKREHFPTPSLRPVVALIPKPKTLQERKLRTNYPMMLKQPVEKWTNDVNI